MRFIMMGSRVLCEGFTLIGFEVFPEATSDTVEKVLDSLLKNKDKALIFLENYLFQQPTTALLRARSDTANLVITEIPPLNAPESYRPAVEDLVIRVLGANALSPLNDDT